MRRNKRVDYKNVITGLDVTLYSHYMAGLLSDAEKKASISDVQKCEKKLRQVQASHRQEIARFVKQTVFGLCSILVGYFFIRLQDQAFEGTLLWNILLGMYLLFVALGCVCLLTLVNLIGPLGRSRTVVREVKHAVKVFRYLERDGEQSS